MNELLSNAPHSFTENRGQLDNDEVRFYAQDSGLWFTDDGVWIEIKEEIKLTTRESTVYSPEFRPATEDWQPKTIEYHRVILKQEFIGANQVRPIGRERLCWNSNFFYGNDSSKWRTDVPNYREVYYHNLYDGIDLRYYTNDKGLKYDFIVHPRADISRIRVRYNGIEGLELDNFGNLIIKTVLKNIVDDNLYIYQKNNDLQNKIKGRIKIYNNNEYCFELTEEYRKQEILIIDPQIRLGYSTYIGGNANDSGRSIAVDKSGNIIIAGRTLSLDFPTTPGAYDKNFNSEYDVFILKLDPMVSNFIYSTFIGGNGIEYWVDVAIDISGCAYVTGSTNSTNFPTTTNAFDKSFNSNWKWQKDAFCFKINENGSLLLYSTYIGGGNDDICRCIVVDSNNCAYIAGYTISFNFPITEGAYDKEFNGQKDCFVTKLNQNGSKLIYSTFIGGSEEDGGCDIILDMNNNATVTGFSFSSDFPTTPYAYDDSHDGSDDTADGILFQLNHNGSSLIYSTYFGGNDWDYGYAITSDSLGNSIITGETRSPNFPTTFGAFDCFLSGIQDSYICKFNSNASILIYSTYIGGNSIDSGAGIALDLNNNIFITGYTNSTDFPITVDSVDKSCEKNDIFLLGLSAKESILYSTYLGGIEDERGTDIAIDNIENILITGETKSLNFPATIGAFDRTHGGQYDAFVSKFISQPYFNITAISLLMNTTPTDTIYTKLCPYTFKINISHIAKISDFTDVNIILDPLNANIQLSWNPISGQFLKISDPYNYVSIEQSSKAYNYLYFWSIDFNLTFNWRYPNENFHDIQVYATSLNLPIAWFNATDFYRVENDVVFNGTLLVKGEDNRTINNGGLVCGGERFTWTNLTPVYEGTTDVYPPADELDVSIWDEAGNSWLDSPAEGQPFYIETTTPNIINTNGYTYVVNLTGIPPECDATNETFVIRIDADNVTFLNPMPDNMTWQRTKSVPVSINITDHGGGIVNGSSVMRCLSSDNGTTWSDWEGISELQSKVCITPQDVVLLKEGKDNLIKWQAKDSVGHGPDESDEYRILVDTVNVTFSDPIPEVDHESITEEVKVGITISDNTSGVDASTISYSISTDSGVFWSYWAPVIGYENGTNINITLNLTFPNGTANRIRWRAADIAGNGFTISKEYPVIVNTWLQTFIPRVRLLSPMNNAVIPIQLVKLSWMLENKNLEGVTYDVYFDTVNPPNTTRAMGIMNTNFLIDNLTDGETYYWTVVPRIGEDVGCCVSGVWSFTVNTSVPFPTVRLTHPKNGSIIPTLLPTLVWSFDYEGTEILTFDIYLGSNKDPGREIMSYPKTYYLPETNLEDNTTYYWKIIPMAGDIQGPESEIWSFTIKRDYIPRFGLNLTLEPAVVKLEAAEMTYVKAIVKNLGEFNDTISLSIQIPNDVNLGAIVNEPVTVNALPEGIAVFNITIITPHGIKEGEIDLIAVAVSEIAPEYGLSVEESATLKIIILGAEKSESDKSSTEIWIIFIIIVILIIMVLFVILLIKRRKRSGQEEPSVETGMVKPITTPTLDKLNGDTTTKPTLAQPTQGPIPPTPKLASPKTVGRVPAQQQIPQTEQRPQLPPAQSHITKPGVEKSTSTPTLTMPRPTLATPKQTQTSTAVLTKIQAEKKDDK